MAHHCIKYRLTADGAIPSFVCLHPESVNGAFFVPDPSTPSPRDMVLIGLSENDDVGDAEIIASQTDLQTYLAAVGENWTQLDPAQPGNPEATIPFDPAAAAQWVWDRKVALDAA
jgi:hypothetical protein